MTQVRKLLSESAVARWTALILVSLAMFFAYFFMDIAAPLQSALAKAPYLWTPEVFGMSASSLYILNVFALFLIVSGIILDKMGIRFTILTSSILMIIGSVIKFYSLTDNFLDSDFSQYLSSFLTSIPSSAKLSFLGFAIFGVGVEMAGITVSRTIYKWFKGKGLALAMSIEMSIARLGLFAVLNISPYFIKEFGVDSSILFGCLLLCIGLICCIAYVFMDKKFDEQEGKEATSASDGDSFKISDLKKIITNPGFLAISGLCVLFYSAIFPFQKFAVNLINSRLGIEDSYSLVSLFPVGAMILTPLLGIYIDRVGKSASMMIYGAILLTITHLGFAFIPEELFTEGVAITLIVLLGTSFALVPASLWPSIPKIIDEKLLGSAYGTTFWIQNIGLAAFPIIIGLVLTATNPGVAAEIAAGHPPVYDYTIPSLIFAGLGVAAAFLGVVLKRLDRKHNYGLELPNIKH